MGKDSDCYSDGLGIFEGTAGALTHIGQFCGIHNPPPIASHIKELTLFLNTDSKCMAKSFLANCASERTHDTVVS
ncbi:hypothetical protein X801_07914 [Opisthorchis viverrini]|uniref:CUB domain-containing protein n=1 Tax=Opisthorchis viverrini TaxID=6198 RepID=A0A1S8WPD6_OPIVI|nr:hypothetical protein X801_07914 [Opisthorchis viverrini]